MCRHSIRKSNAGKENGRFEKISRNTLHTYINASFREDEEESDDMKVELIVPDYDEDRKGVGTIWFIYIAQTEQADQLISSFTYMPTVFCRVYVHAST